MKDHSIVVLGLSVRSVKALKRAEIYTLSALTVKTEEELLEIKNFGATCLQEVKEKLEARGLSLTHYDPEAGFEVPQKARFISEWKVVDGWIIAEANDGTLWRYNLALQRKWEQLPELPSL